VQVVGGAKLRRLASSTSLLMSVSWQINLTLQEDDEEKQQPQSGTHITDVMGAGWLDPLASIGASLEALDLRYLLDEAALGVACGHVQRALATHAGGEFHSSVLADAARYVEAVPLHFLHAVLHPQVGNRKAMGKGEIWGNKSRGHIVHTTRRIVGSAGCLAVWKLRHSSARRKCMLGGCAAPRGLSLNALASMQLTGCQEPAAVGAASAVLHIRDGWPAAHRRDVRYRGECAQSVLSSCP